MKSETKGVVFGTKEIKGAGMVFRRGQVVTALSVGTINVSKGDQCSCTGQPGQCD